MVVYNIEPFGSFARIGNRNEVCAKVRRSNFGGICEQIRSIFLQRRRPNFGGYPTRTHARVLFISVFLAYSLPASSLLYYWLFNYIFVLNPPKINQSFIKSDKVIFLVTNEL